MKICLISTSFPRSKSDDAGIFIARLVSALAVQGALGTIIAPHSEGAALEESFSIWKIIRVKYGMFFPGRLAYGSGILPNLRTNPLLLLQIPGLLVSLAVKAIQVSKDSDLIHAHWLASALPGLLASKISKKPLVVTIRGEDLKLLALPLVGSILRILFRKNVHITTVSQHFEEKLQKYFPDKKIHLIRNGVSRIAENKDLLANVQKQYGLTGISYSIYAGRVIPLKRLEIIIKLLSMLKDKNSHLVICGSLDDVRYLEQLKLQIAKTNLERRIHFLGATSPDDYAVLLSGAKLYFSASEYEGRPNAVLEALAQGIPPILSDIPGHSSLVKDGHNAVLFPPNNLERAAVQIATLLEDSNLHQKMGQHAINSVSDLSWENCASQYINLFKSLESH